MLSFLYSRTFISILSVTAISSTIGLFLCGLEICQRIRNRGNTEGTGSAPFLIAFLSCAYWTQYGLSKGDQVVITVNFVGLSMQSAYLAYYYCMTRNKRWLNRIILCEFLLIAAMEYAVRWAEFDNGFLDELGAACCALNIINIAAPLFALGEVLRTKSAESLPLPLIVACFVVSCQWLLYGILVDDWVIRYPNYAAVVLSMVQLSLVGVYGRAPPTTRGLPTKVPYHEL